MVERLCVPEIHSLLLRKVNLASSGFAPTALIVEMRVGVSTPFSGTGVRLVFFASMVAIVMLFSFRQLTARKAQAPSPARAPRVAREHVGRLAERLSYS